MRIAVIGLGTMGAHFARNLVAAGHEVVGCDVDAGRAEALGIAFAAGPADAAAGAELTVLSLPSVAIVEEVVLGPEGVAGGADPGSIVIDMSTSPPSLARRLAEALRERGVAFLDAPVSGGPRGAEDATLTIMVGGEAETFERAEPVLRSLGSLVAHVGGHGAGQTVKLLNNLLAGVNMAAIAECSAVAEQAGIDPALLFQLVSASTGDSRVLRTRFPLPGVDERHPCNHGFAPMFTVDLIEKDLQLARQLAEEHGVSPSMLGAALAGYQAAQAAGHGALDYSAVFLSRRPDAGESGVLEGR